ncbi:hypothetical protein ACLKA7_005587 [Drosophila subpalustris]
METLEWNIEFEPHNVATQTTMLKGSFSANRRPASRFAGASLQATASSLELSGLSVLLEAHFAKVNPAESNISTNCLRIESNCSKESAPASKSST